MDPLCTPAGGDLPQAPRMPETVRGFGEDVVAWLLLNQAICAAGEAAASLDGDAEARHGWLCRGGAFGEASRMVRDLLRFHETPGEAEA